MGCEGIEQRLFIANKIDILDLSYSAVEGEENVITNIIMKAGKTFFEFEGVNETVKAQNSLVRNALSNTYKHQVDFSVFEVDNTALLNLQQMAYQPQVVIVFGVNDSSLGNGIFRLYGAQAGLDLVTDEQIHGDAETGGAQVCQLNTPDAGRAETQKPPVIWATDYDATLTMINSLLTTT